MNKSDNRKLNRKEYESAAAVLKSLPQVVYIETTDACNLRCPMCPITMGVQAYIHPVKYFGWEHFLSIKPFIEAADRCIMSGGGEPLLHPRFLDMIEGVKKAGAQTIFNTNGTLLTEKIAKELVRLQADTMSFSVDGATPETYARVRVGAELSTVAKNVSKLIGIKRAEGSDKPYLNLQMTLMDENRGEIKAMVELAAEWGIRHLVIEPLTPVFNEDDKYREYTERHEVKADKAADDIRAARKMAGELGLIFTSHYLALLGDEPGFGDPRSFRCVEPWVNIGFRADGTIFPCCGTSHTMGHIDDYDKDNLTASWNNAEYQALRKAFADMTPPSYCELCLSEGRAMHFNEDLLSE